MRTLLERQVFAFFWSPDGETIAVIAFPNDAQPGPGEAGAPGTRTVASARGIPPLAAEPGGVRFHLGFVDAASGTLRGQRDVRLTELFAFQLLPFFDQYALSHRYWASDCSAIALPISGDAGLEQVVVYPADGGEPRTVATGGIGFWSP